VNGAEDLLEQYVPVVATLEEAKGKHIYVRAMEAHQLERMAEARAEVQALIAAVKA
jgi:hypothetical protein